MSSKQYDVIVIGGGPAGLAAALSAAENGARTAILERDGNLGGVLQQCIHVGFGLKYFGEELAGPEYADRFISRLKDRNVDVYLDTTVISIADDELLVQAVNPTEGVIDIKAGAIILAMGCRERTRTALSIAGTRPAGVYTAGSAQRYMNVQNECVGKKIVILGSGDIGMVMARRFTLEGSEVKAVVEIMPYLSGLTRNKVQCLDDFGIPLYFNHTVIDIKGRERVSSVLIAEVDEKLQPKMDTVQEIECDTLLISVGLIPENELSRSCGVEINPLTQGAFVDQSMQTGRRGIFACGNVLQVYDLVDKVSKESEIAGKNAAQFALNEKAEGNVSIKVKPADGLRYTLPNVINDCSEDVVIHFRVSHPDKNVRLTARLDGKIVASRKAARISPGEMEQIIIPASVLNNSAPGSLLTVGVEREGE